MEPLAHKITTVLQQFPTEFTHVIKEKHPEAEIFLVGGCVRDAILDRATNDLDFVIRGVAIEKLQETLATLGIVNLVGKHFGVLKFTPFGTQERHCFDIALPRTEHAGLSGGYKDVATQSDALLPIEDDLSRRDFTINAIAYNLTNQTIVDPFKGIDDCSQGIIRTVGVPEERFQEDYSRMLRALRFSVQLGFMIEPVTRTAIIEKMTHINDEHAGERTVPYETIARELLKSLTSDPVATLDMWDSVGAWEQVMPELLVLKNSPQHHEFHAEGDVWTHTRLALQKLYSPEFTQTIQETFPKFAAELACPRSSNVVLAVLLHDIAKPDTIQTPEKDGVDRIRNHNHEGVGATKARAMIERLKLSSPPDIGIDAEQVAWLIKMHLIAGNATSEMKATTLEKYFFTDPQKGADLLTVILADGSATLSPEGIPATKTLYTLIEKINSLLAVHKQKSLAMKLPKPIVDGTDIMNHFNLPPSRRIGELIALAREAQLTGTITTRDEAFALLTTHL